MTMHCAFMVEKQKWTTGKSHGMEGEQPFLHSYTLGIEFAQRKDQELIDSVVTGKTYNEHLARTILFNFFVLWGYQEYLLISQLILLTSDCGE